MILDVKFQQDDFLQREQQHEIPRILLSIDHFCETIQEIRPHGLERWSVKGEKGIKDLVDEMSDCLDVCFHVDVIADAVLEQGSR
jgi:hypothetical protein